VGDGVTQTIQGGKHLEIAALQITLPEAQKADIGIDLSNRLFDRLRFRLVYEISACVKFKHSVLSCD